MATVHEHSIEGERLHVPGSAWTHDGFRAWVTSDDFPSDVRASFVAGEVFLEMSPEALDSHNKVKAAILAAIMRIAEEEDLGEAYADRMLLTNEAAGLSTEPDAAFASWATLEARLVLVPGQRHAPDGVELVGAPDVVVEVVSDSSRRKDLVTLRAAYARAGIPEYWIVDARDAALEFTILSLDAGAYRAAATVGTGQASAVFGRAFALTRSTNRVGRWRYRLDVVG